MTTTLDTISVVASSILSSALVTGVVQILFKERADTNLERLRNELATEKSAREEDRRRVSEQLRTQFSWLYVERAKAMNEIHSCVIEVDKAIRDCVPPLAGWGLAADHAFQAHDPTIYRERVRHAMELGASFEDTLLRSKLLFSDDLARKLRSLVLAYESIFFELDEGESIGPAIADSPAMMRGQSEAGHILGQIEREFRLLYGSLGNMAPDLADNVSEGG
jgi:hypothetical protein